MRLFFVLLVGMAVMVRLGFTEDRATVLHSPEQLEFFESQVRPLLVAKCVACHRADSAKGGFDLSTRSSLLRGGESGAAVVLGKAEQSPLYLRVISQNGQKPEMPEKGEPLSEKEAAALRKWIEQGAAWPDKLVLREKSKADASFWSLQPVAKVTPPAVAEAPANWRSHPIDRFVWQKLKERGLSPNEPADARTFIRRATFDLLGLPPTPEEVAAFERECREEAGAGGTRRQPVGTTDFQSVEKRDGLEVHRTAQAAERLIDRLLKSPHYGERWGRHWLDIAHYADTHGFERDQLRPNAWRYRDYVIAALNNDVRYDVFLKQQIAGDVIAPDDPQSVIATGFLAAGPWDFVGQVETRSDVLKRAARAGDLDDIVTQVMTATMGLTMNCARCHDHKLDPITQEDYYRLTAIFAGVKRGERDVSAPESQQLAQRKQELTAQLTKARSEIARLSGGGWNLSDIVGGGDGLGSGKKEQGIDVRNGKPVTEKLSYHRDLPLNQLRKVEAPDVAQVRPFVKHVFVPDGRGAVLIDEQRTVQGVPATSGHFWDAIRNGPLNAQVSTTLAGIDYATSGHSILGLHANGAITFDVTRLRASQDESLKGLKFTAVVGFGSGTGGAASVADFSVFVDQELKFQKLKMKKDETASLDVALPIEAKTLTLIATDGGDGIGHDLLFLGDAKLTLDRRESPQTDADKQRLASLRSEVVQLEKALAEIPTPGRVFAIVTDTPPEVRVLGRGNPEDPQQAVTPGVPSCVKHTSLDIDNVATSEGERRRRLAEWIAHPDNPLTRRVLVNRLWHHHFGQGLVNTPSDFGYGGDRPSHPELLDWLADEVLRSEWSLKTLHKTIMLSAAYRQSSAIVPERQSEKRGIGILPVGTEERSGNNTDRLEAYPTEKRDLAERARIDGSNRLLWRQNARRLDAESLRDAVLFATGKLNREMGGPGYRDFKYTEAYAPIYEYVTPDKPELWRRSVYRFVVRTTPHQFMSTLDCPDPANLTPARVTTTTALQALALSNNEFMLQQAEHLAARVKADVAETTAACRRAFELTFQRQPTAAELKAAESLVAQQGLFALCRALLNANEFVYVD